MNHSIKPSNIKSFHMTPLIACLLITISLTTPIAHATLDGVIIDMASQLIKPTQSNKADKPTHTQADNQQTAQSNDHTNNTHSPISDDEIHARIVGIFGAIDGLDKINVHVKQGVVTLTGESANDKHATQAVKIALRISDVLAVNDHIHRTLDVQDNVSTVISDWTNQAKSWTKALPLLLVALAMMAALTWFGNYLSHRQKIWQKITPNPFVADLLAQTVKVVFFMLGLMLALSLMGAQSLIGTLLGGAGVLGIAVGFAVKDTIENYIASLMLSIRQPFRAKDRVKINDKEGIVVRLTSRATILMTLDGNHLRIPNAEVFKGTILNYSKNPERRFTFELGVDANNDPLAAIKVGLDAINALSFVLQEPKAIAIINEVGDSNIVLEFQVWVNQNQTDFLKARTIAIREAKHALENNGFHLPEPIYMLNFDQALEDAIINLAHQLGGNAASHQTTHQNTNTKHANKQYTNDHADDEKYHAKQRAKQILGDACIDDILNTAPDQNLLQKVEKAILDNKENDLLSNRTPEE